MAADRLQSHSEEDEREAERTNFAGYMTQGDGAAALAGADAYGVGYGVDTARRSTATGSSDETAVASQNQSAVPSPPVYAHPTEEVEAAQSRSSLAESTEEYNGGFIPVKAAGADRPQRPTLATTPSKRQVTEEDVIRHLSRRNTQRSALSRVPTEHDEEEQAEIERLMSRMFGKTRQAQSEEEKTRHVGVVFKNLTVKGMGLGAALQPTFGDVFLDLPRWIGKFFSKGPRKAASKPPVKTILNDFSGVIKPGEMCLVLGRPGSGCSTFLKVLGNQREGYVSIDGDVLYGGADAKDMHKHYRGEVVYNPEDGEPRCPLLYCTRSAC